jgi:glutathione S-transferase
MEDHSLIFYMNPQSRSRMVRWMLEETEAPYETKIIRYGEEMKSKPYLSINPMGKVPANVHGDKVVTECPAICAYLADTFPDKNLAPALSDRADYYRWLFFAAGPVEAAVAEKAFGFKVPVEKQRSIGYGNFETTINTLAFAVSQSEFIAGDKFSAADVYIGSHVGWGLMLKTLPERNEFIDYFERLRTRPAYIRANQLDDALVVPE